MYLRQTDSSRDRRSKTSEEPSKGCGRSLKIIINIISKNNIIFNINVNVINISFNISFINIMKIIIVIIIIIVLILLLMLSLILLILFIIFSFNFININYFKHFNFIIKFFKFVILKLSLP